MDDSILESIKIILGVDPQYEAFDSEIIMAINSALMALTQLGLGPQDGFLIQDKWTTWSDILKQRKDLESVRSYVGVKARMLFDPPTNSYLMQVLNNIATELEWRIRTQLEEVANELL